MSVRIPQYEDRLTPGGGQINAQARGVEVSGAVGQAMQNLGNAGVGLAGINMHIAQQQAEANEMSSVGEALAKFKQAKEEQYQKLATSYRNPETQQVDGDGNVIDNGDYGGFHGMVVKSFEDDRNAFLANIQSDRVKKYAQQHLLQLQDGYASASLQFEAKQTRAKRDNELIAASDTYGKQLINKLTPDDFKFANDAIGGMIANNDMLTADEKVDRLRKAKNALLMFALQGVKERNPQALTDALYEAVGKEAGVSMADVKGAATANMPGPDTASVKGLVTPGNIDLANRPQLKNSDGSISTVSSFSVNVDGKEVLLTPITEDGKKLTEQQAIEKYRKDGKHLGIFDSPEAASAYAQQLHEYQDRYYSGKKAEGQAPAGIEISASMPMGMRNRNPGNIKYAGQADAEKSDLKDQGDPQARYATDDAGFEAMYRLVLKKFDGGKTSIEQLIAGQGGWTPGNKAAANNIAKAMGVAVDAPINLRDPAMLESFGRALVRQEQGAAAKAYDDKLYGQTAQAVLTGKKGSAAQSDGSLGNVVVTGEPQKREVDPFLRELVSKLQPEQIVPLMNQAEAEVHRQQTSFRASIEPKLNNDLTAFNNGEMPSQLLTYDDFVKAYGEAEGTRRYAGYDEARSMASDINVAKTMPVDKQAAFLEARRPSPNDPLYAVKVDKYQKLATAIDAQNKTRAADPIAWAGANRYANVQPLNYDNKEAFASELSKRQGVASAMTSTFGTPPALLTKAEQATLTASLQLAPYSKKMELLEVIRNAVSDAGAYRTIIQQIAPDDPLTAVAGSLMAQTWQSTVTTKTNLGLSETKTQYDPKTVAGLIVEGNALLNPNKAQKEQDGRGKPIVMPEDKKLREDFANRVHDAFAGDPQKADLMFQAARAYYAAKAARDGDLSPEKNDDRWNEAIDAVTGGATEINGKGYVLRPWGMSEAQFKNQAKAKFDEAIQANGFTGSMVDQWGAYGMQSLPDPEGKGRDLYLLKSGGGYLSGADGKPIVLNLTVPPSQVSQIPTDTSRAASAGLPAVNPKPEKAPSMSTGKAKIK